MTGHRSAFGFRLPPARPRRRPPNIAYAADDRPAAGVVLTLGAQHAVMAVALAAYALVAAKLAGLSIEDSQSFLACTMLGTAVATFLQAWGGRFGAGALIVHLPDPLMVPFVALAIGQYGAGVMFPVGIAAGLAAIAASWLMPYLRPLFPPTVLGVVVCMGGFSLVQGSFTQSLGLDERFAIDPFSLLIAGVTLGVIVGFSVWGSRPMKLFSLLAGIVAGVAVAVPCGYVSGLERFAGTPLLEFPRLPKPVFDIAPGMLAVIVLVTLLAQLDTFASVIIIDKMDDAGWRRADMGMIARGIQANGLANIFSGLIGGMSNGPSTANIGLCHATGATSRYIGILVALLVACVALLPRATLAITLIPTPVIGAINIYAAAFLVVSGIELAASRALDDRGVFMIGISLAVGVGVLLMPALITNVPPALHHIIGSGFVMAGLTAILLNLLFRIGTSMRAQRTLDMAPGDINAAIIEFVETQAASWAVRLDVVHRAALAALEAAELIGAAGAERRPERIQAHFDEYNFDVELEHSGRPLTLDGGQALDPAALLDHDDAAVAEALAKVSGVLLHGIADKVRFGERPEGAYVLLHFDL